ncbi:hypothetical protein SUVZ_13G0820 [Saccharomyces uvarum]|uniref:Uncharacterized protein n=1 Tax=Saccharomyces uvarum TaxID=230603 RepID=A0AA35J6K3_SACUV|nr:hypothetical protein N7582_004260 [Saccharomyces uvarum]CAI4047966.1 hypothetical protein SUVC_13G0800 [Saccharomyces uvarum]CAI4049148.1 hypothetical protein SUVZ_13G0820 [Saccharomyces uvarum]
MTMDQGLNPKQFFLDDVILQDTLCSMSNRVNTSVKTGYLLPKGHVPSANIIAVERRGGLSDIGKTPATSAN